MNQWAWRWSLRVVLAGLLVIGLAGFAVGCDDDDDDKDDAGTEAPAEPDDGEPGGEEAEPESDGDTDGLEGASIVDRGTPWNGTRTGDGGETRMTFILRRDGNELDGTYLDAAGNGGRIEGTIDGVTVELVVTLTGGPLAGETWDFEGQIDVPTATMTGWLDGGGWRDRVELSQ